MVPDLCPLL